MRVAYLINQYPKVSHSFIRREIMALEQLGVEVRRFALRGWDGEVIDPDDLEERNKTRYVLKKGVTGLFMACVQVASASPVRFFGGLRTALTMARGAASPLPLHLVYLAEACRLRLWLKAEGVDHAHAHFGTNPAEVLMLTRVLGGPAYSFTVHGPEEFDRPQALHVSKKIEHASFVVAISSYGRSQLFRWIERLHWNKVKVVHCGLDKAFHRVSAVPVPVEPRLVCVGRLCEQKGQLLLIEAARRLAEKRIEFQIVLAGDGEMRSEIEELIQRYGLQSRVRITGWISSDQVRDELLAARALVLPSFAEGLPVVIMEAMALRRPVLTTYVAGIPELVIDGVTGWLFPAGCIEALTSCMEKCLASSGTELQAMGEAAYRRVLERHDIETEAAKLAGFFKGAQS